MSTFTKSIKFNLSEAQKVANDFENAKILIDKYADQTFEPERIKNIKENIGIHAGRWKEIEDLNTGVEITVDGETFTIGNSKLRHYDKIGRISRGMHGSMIASPLVFIIKDESSKSKSIRDKLRLEGVKDLLYEKYIAPKIDLITKQELMKTGTSNMFDLDPEQQQQIQQQIQQRTQQESPEEILDILDKIKTPDEQVCQLLFKHTSNAQKIKQKYDTGGEFAIITGEEYYRPSIINGLPHLQVLIPSQVTYGGSPSNDMVEDGTFATYHQQISIEDTIARHGLGFLKGDINNLDRYYSGEYVNGYTGNNASNRVEMLMTEVIGKDATLSQTNFLTRDGQNMLNAVYNRIGNSIGGYRISEKYVTWRWTTRMKVVTRLFNGLPKDYIVSDHYTKNPATDLKVRTIVVPQTWQATRLAHDWYINIEPIPYQYDSIQNPFNSKLGIYGGQYNTLLGTTKNYSLIDNGKIWNFRYNQIMARMDEIESTDHGKIALLYLNSKPEGIKVEDWLTGMITSKIGIVSQNKEFQQSGADKKVFDSVDLSRMSDAAATIQKLQYTESELQKSMYYSDAKSGDIGQYATNQNSALQVEATDRQLNPFMSKHRLINTNVSNALLKLSLIAYRDNEVIKDAVLDDLLKAHYELNMKNEDIGQYALTVVDTMNELNSVKRMTDLALAFVQNGVIGLSELSRLFSATTMSEAQDIIDEAEAKRKKEMNQKNEADKELQAQNAKYQQDLMKMKQEYDTIEANMDRKMKVTLADIGSHLMSNANDIDGNKVSDALQKAVLEVTANKQINDNILEFKREELNKKIANDRKKSA